MNASKKIQRGLDDICKTLESCDDVLTANSYFIKVKLPFTKSKKVVFGLIINYKDGDENKVFKFQRKYKIDMTSIMVAYIDFLARSAGIPEMK